MTNLKQQTEARIQKTRESNPEFMKAVENLFESARKSGGGDNALDLGQHAPEFELPNSNGECIALSSLISNGPVVVSFYRGSWCPYCSLEIAALQKRLPDIKSLGAQLVAISPQQADGSLTQSEKDALEFHVLSDQDALVASQYGVAWNVPELMLEHMRVDRKLNLEEINNGNGTILPIPATFVIGSDGVVTWRFVNVDYRNRAEPDDVVRALAELPKNMG